MAEMTAIPYVEATPAIAEKLERIWRTPRRSRRLAFERRS